MDFCCVVGRRRRRRRVVRQCECSAVCLIVQLNTLALRIVHRAHSALITKRVDLNTAYSRRRRRRRRVY